MNIRKILSVSISVLLSMTISLVAFASETESFLKKQDMPNVVCVESKKDRPVEPEKNIPEPKELLLQESVDEEDDEIPLENTYAESANVPKKFREGIQITEDEYEIICKVVCLEAGGACESMQRAVAECILNRISHPYWGGTVNGVVYSKDPGGFWEFEVVGWLDTAEPTDLTKNIVRDVFDNGCKIAESRVMFFRKSHYHEWVGAIPEFQIENVFFSSSIWLEV